MAGDDFINSLCVLIIGGASAALARFDPLPAGDQRGLLHNTPTEILSIIMIYLTHPPPPPPLLTIL